MAAAIEQEWFSAQEFAKMIGSDPDDVRKRIKAGLLAGGHMMPSITGNRHVYKVHYPTFLASLPGHEETTEA